MRAALRGIRRAGLAMLALVGLAFVAFGIDDLRMDAPPPTHDRYFGRLPAAVPAEVHSLVIYMFDGQGGLFLGSGLALLLLAARPIARGDRVALAAAFAIVLFGNAGIVWCLHQMGAGYAVPAWLLAIGIAGSALCLVRPGAG